VSWPAGTLEALVALQAFYLAVGLIVAIGSCWKDFHPRNPYRAIGEDVAMFLIIAVAWLPLLFGDYAAKRRARSHGRYPQPPARRS
jgi:hypothetical protein